MASKKASNKRQRGGQKSCSNVFSMFEQSQIQEFKEAFGCIDQDRDGVIKKQDLKETYAQLGKLNVQDEELEQMLNEGKGPLNFTVFLSLFGEKLNGTDPEETILAAFKLFDPNGTGFVNKDEFKRLLMTQADKFTPDEVDQAFSVAPIDPTEMPIASGAAGRVDVGEDVNTTWTPDGLKRKPKPAYKNHGSYLQRYNALKQSEENKSSVLHVKQESAEESRQETTETPVKNGDSDGHHIMGKPSEKASKNSTLCVLL
ncbi:myosin regulatory light chain 2, atrial isoform [Solea senegalensis]|uniref:Myosin regulatory light chain 2, atrial isoform n=1 Tax=Solea senegalensis TaxID=28829 RepID=A0AAV6QDW5_SOLSE|nr:myosin regulatory light chain 2, atrial isoform [Solea senegalensis]